MAKLPPIKRLAIEDFLSQKSWIGTMLYPINLFFTVVVAALDHGLTFTDNLSAVVKSIDTTGVYPLYFSWTLKSKPVGLWAVKAYESKTTHVNFTTAYSVDWEYTPDNQVKINGFPGLTATATAPMTVTVIAITG